MPGSVADPAPARGTICIARVSIPFMFKLEAAELLREVEALAPPGVHVIGHALVALRSVARRIVHGGMMRQTQKAMRDAPNR